MPLTPKPPDSQQISPPPDPFTTWLDKFTTNSTSSTAAMVEDSYDEDENDSQEEIALESNDVNPVQLPAYNAYKKAAIHVSKSRTKEKMPIEYDTLLRDVFRVGAPNRVTPAKAENFIELQNLVIRNPYEFQEGKNLIGIEVEAENVLKIDVNIPLYFWAVDVDNSLRNNGREFRSVPIPLKYVEYALMQLFNGINKDIEFSNRTSIHIHVDVRGMKVGQILSFLFAYTVCENLLFKFCGNERRSNIFCVPITETNFFHQLDKSVGPLFIRHINNNWSKYTAFNLLPIAKMGTVEFRHMPGTSDVKKLLVWIDMINRLKTYCYKQDLDTVIEKIGVLNTNSRYSQFLNDVFGELTTFLDMSMLQQDMENAVAIVKNSSMTNIFHQRIISANRNEKSAMAKLIGYLPPSRFTDTQVKLLTTIRDKWFNSLTPLEDVYDNLHDNPQLYEKSAHIPKDVLVQIIGQY